MRKDDKPGRYYYRSSDRVFQSNGAWYFESREENRGPFASREEAVRDLESFVEARRFFDEKASVGRSAAPDPSPSLTLLDPDDY